MKHMAMVVFIFVIASCGKQPSLGEFDSSTDVGAVDIPGSAQYLPGSDEYRLTGSGENIWATEDGFQFVWKRVGGDATLVTDLEFVGEGVNAHRKAGLMIRESLDAGSPYADAVVHGDGLTSLQYREAPGGETAEIQSPISAPGSLMLERHGDVMTLSVARDGGEFQPVGSLSVAMDDSVYIGLVVCSHDNSVSETAIFTNVSVDNPGVFTGDEREVESTLEIFNVASGERRIVHRTRRHFEAPNWTPDGSSLIVNSGGLLYTIPVTGGELTQIDTGMAVRCNNDHGISPDGTMMVISDQTNGPSQIYTFPFGGGEPTLVTENAPSYWHGWSPDGGTLAYCAERNGEYDVYTIPVTGGAETRLTNATGLDDGPEYSPDGAYIYFNSVRTGQMKIWRMNADGSDEVQITPVDEWGDWFAHPSPDGGTLVFVSFDKSVEGHPANKDVALRMMPADGNEPTIIARLFGGQGTINVPSWSPDGGEFAFVSYRLIGAE